MPFIIQERRAPLLTGDVTAQNVGELCFLEYSWMMGLWRSSPRWTTVHSIFRDITGLRDDKAAALLAFLEFYFNHGHRYELEKKEQNGDI